MHILHVIDSIDAPGGAEQALASLAPRYIASGVTLDVAYLLDRQGLQVSLSEAGASLFCLSGSGGRLGWVRRARRLIEDRRPDLIHTTLFEADIVGRTAGAWARTPVASTLANVAYGPEHLADPSLSAWKIRAARVVDSATARLVTRFHAVSSHVAQVMGRRLHIPRQRIEVVPRGRDPRKLGIRTQERRDATRAALGVGRNDPLLLVAARHEYQKGFDVLVRSLLRVRRELADAVLLIAGREGKQTPLLRASVRSLGLDRAVRFLGPRSDVADLMCAADVFVLPSRWEGFPGTVLEAMAVEAPIVASDIPPVRELVEDRVTGLLVPPEEPELLGGAIAMTLADRESAVTRSRLARERFLSEFTVDRAAERMLSFFDRALSERPSSRARMTGG